MENSVGVTAIAAAAITTAAQDNKFNNKRQSILCHCMHNFNAAFLCATSKLGFHSVTSGCPIPFSYRISSELLSKFFSFLCNNIARRTPSTSHHA